MKALVFDIRVNSLYSIRIPFTWQSALTYPVLPPSAVIGLLANAIQRYRSDKHPLDYLNEIEDQVVWAGSRLLSPCVIKSYTTSAIVKWEDSIGGKFTNALGRQFAYSRKLQIAVIFKGDMFSNDIPIAVIAEALKTTPLTCGDSESPISIDGEVMIKDVNEYIKDDIIQTKFPIPFTKYTDIKDGNGQVYLMHERCKKQDNNFPLVSYLIPICEEKKILKPSLLKVNVKVSNEKVYKVYKIDEIGYVIARLLTEGDKGKTAGKKRKSKKK